MAARIRAHSRGATASSIHRDNQRGAGTCSASHTYLDDNPTVTPQDNYSVSVTVKDNGGTANGGADTSNTLTTTVTVKNVKPTTSNPMFTFDPVTHVATASFDYADVGTQDTHGGSWIKWKNGTTDLSPQPTSTVNATTKTVTSTVTLAARLLQPERHRLRGRR